jgi:hypothetical protein
MRASLFVLAAATILAAAVPASAQGVRIEGPGVGVRVGEPNRWHGDRWGERRFYRDRVTVGGEGCRSVTVRKRLPDGSVVVRRRSSC